MTSLPISKYLSRISGRLANINKLVLQAEPGAGKSTALPLSLLNEPWLHGKKIIMLEPRRVAAKSIAYYLAKQLGEQVGQRIGYQIKNDKKISKDTILHIVTEGILTRRLQSDPELADVALIIFDEFHERSIHADLSLLLTLEIQQSLREDLKLLVMSATIDTKKIANYMEGAEIIECIGRSFPVEVHYIDTHSSRNHEPLHQKVIKVLRGVLSTGSSGDILVFLPGQSEIKKCLTESKEHFSSEFGCLFLPLYGALSLNQQEQALVADSKGRQRVIFTTNIAETSLTIAGVTCVIDSGLERVLMYDPVSGLSRLETVYISKASAEQRMGRAGRIQEGVCIRLWNEAKHKSLQAFQGEEILLADLTDLVLEIFNWGITSYEDVNWLTAPPKAHFESARKLLILLKLISEQNKVTPLGVKAVALALPPRLAVMLLNAGLLNEVPLKARSLKVRNEAEINMACELAALLSERDIFYQDNTSQAGLAKYNNSQYRSSDILDRLLAVQDYKNDRNKAFKSYPLKRAAVESLLVNARSFARQLNTERKSMAFTLAELQDSVAELLLYAYPDRIAKRRSDSCGRYHLENGKGVFLDEDDPLFGSKWLLVADCDGQKKEGRIFSAVMISENDLLRCIGDQITEKESFQFDKAKQKVIGQCISSYGAITISSKAITHISSEQFQVCLLSLSPHECFDLLPWTACCENWLARVQWLGIHMEQFPIISKEVLMEALDAWFLPYVADVNSIAQLQKVNLYELLLSTLSWEEQKILEKEAPLEYLSPGNKRIPISYDQQQGPMVSLVLQEVFGEVKTPKLAGGKVPLRFELLSPARRPIQTTSDLGNFWETSYFDVVKDMKGKYPKHRWPDEPLLEKAGRSIKRK